MPRDHHVVVLPSGLIHVTGGKWTTYRSMAEHAIKEAIQYAGLQRNTCKTKNLQVHGWTETNDGTHLSVYGSDAAAIKKLMVDDDLLSEKIHSQYPYTKAELIWMIQQEMAITVEDILSRRIRLLFLDAGAAIEAAPIVAKIMAAEMKKDQQWIDKQISVFNNLAKGYLLK